jgi:hypothetical protein
MTDFNPTNLEKFIRTSKSDPDALISAGNTAFSVNTEAAEVSHEDIKRWYCNLYDTITQYESAKSKREITEPVFSTSIEGIVKNILEPYEFQSACNVVADMCGCNVKELKNTPELRHQFLKNIYSNHKNYRFFPAREQVIDKLIDLRMVPESKYKHKA